MKKKYRNKKVFWIQRMLSLVLIVLFVYLCWYQYDSAKSSKKYEELTQILEDSRRDVPYEEEIETEEIKDPAILKEYQEIYELNRDMVGWLSIEDTRISFPVVQGKDNEYYLEHNFYRQKDRHGTLFVDTDAKINEKQMNLFIYGHHMRDKSMFGMLGEYAKQSFYEDHKIIHFDTLYEKREYEVIAAFRSRIFYKEEEGFKYYDYKNMDSNEELNIFLQNIVADSLIDTGLSAEYGDELITLSTCDYFVSDGRFVVVAKKKA